MMPRLRFHPQPPASNEHPNEPASLRFPRGGVHGCTHMFDSQSTIAHDELVASIDALFGRIDRNLSDLSQDVEEAYRLRAQADDEEEWPHNAA